jgi:hypothetical protein
MSNSVTSEQSRPDPPSSWEIYEEDQQKYHDSQDCSNTEMEFLGDEPPFDVEHSLPNIEEVYTERAIRWRKGSGKSYPRRLYAFAAASIVLLIFIIGISTKIASNNKSAAATAAVTTAAPVPAEDPAKRDTDLMNLLFQTYQQAGLDTSVLTKSGSPQFRAVQWLADLDKRKPDINPSVVQRYALAVMYFSLGGSDWKFKQTKWMNVAHECE